MNLETLSHKGDGLRLWRRPRLVTRLRKRGCGARQETQSPGPYRSLRELSLTGPVGSDIWRPPTFVGNPGSNSNGLCGSALVFGAPGEGLLAVMGGSLAGLQPFFLAREI